MWLGGRVTGSLGLCYSNIPVWVTSFKNMCWLSESRSIPVALIWVSLCEYSLKLGLHLNANRMQMWHAKMMPFDVDVLPKRGKQHSAVWRMFGEQLNAIANSRMLSVNCWYFKGNSHTIRLDVYVHDSFLLHSAMYWHLKNAANLFALTNEQTGNRVYSLPRWMPNNVRMYLVKHSYHLHMPRSCSVRVQV